MDRFDALERSLRERCPALELRAGEPMAQYTSFRIGGPARLMALPVSEEEASCAIRTAADLEITPFFLGNGTNLLVADAGYQGFVIKTAGGFGEVRAEGACLTAGGAVLLSRLARTACDLGLTGLEFAAGIPGSVGGALTMNAGAYGGEMAQVTAGVRVMNPDGTVEEVPGTDCAFGYRRSAFSGGDRLILSARFALRGGDPGEIQARMEDLAARRREKQPLEWPSAGSTFKRPEGHYAGALIDQCGLRGLTVGGAQVSEKHAGFLINRGGATCADVLALMDRVRTEVLRQTGVALEPEIRTLGLE